MRLSTQTTRAGKRFTAKEKWALAHSFLPAEEMKARDKLVCSTRILCFPGEFNGFGDALKAAVFLRDLQISDA